MSFLFESKNYLCWKYLLIEQNNLSALKPGLTFGMTRVVTLFISVQSIYLKCNYIDNIIFRYKTLNIYHFINFIPCLIFNHCLTMNTNDVCNILFVFGRHVICIRCSYQIDSYKTFYFQEGNYYSVRDVLKSD